MDVDEAGQAAIPPLMPTNNSMKEKTPEGDPTAEEELEIQPLPTDFDMEDKADDAPTPIPGNHKVTTLTNGFEPSAQPFEPISSAFLLQAAGWSTGPPKESEHLEICSTPRTKADMHQDRVPTLDTIAQSLKNKGVRRERTASSPLSSIPDLPTFLPSSPPPPSIPLAPFSLEASPAESSSQAAQRSQETGMPKTKKAKPAKVSKPKQPRSKANGKGKKKDEDDYNPRGKGKVVNEEMVDQLASEEDEPPEELMVPTGKGVKRKASDKPVRYKAKPEIAARPRNLTDANIKKLLQGKTTEVQLVTCQRSRYAGRGKCTQCVAKIGGDSCRFKDFRIFPIDSQTGEINGPGYFESTVMVEPPTALPTNFNTPLSEEYISRTEQTVAPILLPLITRELRHVVKTKAIKRSVDAAKNRSVCDFCSSTIFAGYFFCKTCGRDYCLSCERFFADSSESMYKSPWWLFEPARDRLARCTTGGRGFQDKPKAQGTFRGERHWRPDLQPVSRFSEEELRSHWLALADFAIRGEKGRLDWQQLFGYSDEDGVKLAEDIERYRADHSSARDNKPGIPLSDIRAMYTSLTHPDAPLPTDPADLADKSHKFMKIDIDQLDNGTFDQIWSRGEPIVVDGVGKRLKMEWTPDEMIAKFGDEACGVTDCQNNTTWGSTVRTFFEAFKNADIRKPGILKLKDWPATEDFQLTHPGLYNDFCDAIPVPDYTRREGAMNLYAHFPPGPTRPDIGPKMYNAFAAKEDVGGQGSTRMHMDVADAINVMLYASDRPRPRPEQPVTDVSLVARLDGAEAASIGLDREGVPLAPAESTSGSDLSQTAIPERAAKPPASTTEYTAEPGPIQSVGGEPKNLVEVSPASSDAFDEPLEPAEPGCAVWDIFRAEDASKLRTYLKNRFDKDFAFSDPIHSQLFYLDAGLRKDLYETTGVTSFRIYQYPGQAVFIPAGCAHQVCNLADCIKIALDFVSPHNVPRCQQLMQDFREENFVKAWKEDVLQLYNILWFAWLSSRETRERRKKEADAKEAERVATLNDLENGPSTGFGRVQTSSIRDNPNERNGSRPTTPPASPKPVPSDPSRTLVEKLLQAALSAPDPAPPPDARPPSTKTGPKWGVPARTSSAPIKPTLPKVKEETPVPALVSNEPLKASDHFRSGRLPIEFALDLISTGLGVGADEPMDEDQMLVTSRGDDE